MVNEVKKQYGYDAQKIINEFSHLDLIRDEYNVYKPGKDWKAKIQL